MQGKADVYVISLKKLKSYASWVAITWKYNSRVFSTVNKSYGFEVKNVLVLFSASVRAVPC